MFKPRGGPTLPIGPVVSPDSAGLDSKEKLSKQSFDWLLGEVKQKFMPGDPISPEMNSCAFVFFWGFPPFSYVLLFQDNSTFGFPPFSHVLFFKQASYLLQGSRSLGPAGLSLADLLSRVTRKPTAGPEACRRAPKLLFFLSSGSWAQRSSWVFDRYLLLTFRVRGP